MRPGSRMAAQRDPRIRTRVNRRGGGLAGSQGCPLTELHPVPLAQRVHVAAQVVQHPGGQLVDVAGHGRAPRAGGPATHTTESYAAGLCFSTGWLVGPPSAGRRGSGRGWAWALLPPSGHRGRDASRPAGPVAAKPRGSEPPGGETGPEEQGNTGKSTREFSGSPKRPSESTSRSFGPLPHTIPSRASLLITCYMWGNVRGAGDA